MTEKDKAKLERLRAREARLLERGHAVEMKSRAIYEAAAEVGRDLVDLERKLGLRKSLPVSASEATAVAIYKKVYGRLKGAP
jgi:hypothetical protein